MFRNAKLYLKYVNVAAGLSEANFNDSDFDLN